MVHMCYQQYQEILSITVFVLCIPVSTGMYRRQGLKRSTGGSIKNSTTTQNENTQSQAFSTENVTRILNSNDSLPVKPVVLKYSFSSKLFQILGEKDFNSTNLDIKRKLDQGAGASIISSSSTTEKEISLQRTKRQARCATSARQRAICPWEYEYPTNYSLLPAEVQTISCTSGVTRLDHSLIQCHQLYTSMWFKLRNCRDASVSACYVEKRVKSGCVAIIPCTYDASTG